MKNNNTLNYKVFETPMGHILVAGSDVAIHFVSIRDDKSELTSDFLNSYNGILAEDHALLKIAEAQINEYVVGARRVFDLPLHLEGSEFQRRVWNAIAAVPYGATTTYTALAEKTGNAKSFRAAANACGDNPIVLIIPCHRILRSNGDLGGYSAGGVAKKRLLLDLESARASVLKNAA